MPAVSVPISDLIDAGDVAEILGLSSRRVVSVYQARYPDMPRPVIERSAGHTKLWLRTEIEDWASGRLK